MMTTKLNNAQIYVPAAVALICSYFLKVNSFFHSSIVAIKQIGESENRKSARCQIVQCTDNYQQLLQLRQRVGVLHIMGAWYWK